MKKSKILGVLLACSILIASVFISTGAEAFGPGLVIENMPRVIGAAVGMYPDYQGSDNYAIGAAPFGKFRWKGHEQFLLLKAFELQANLLDHPWLRIGPSVNYHFERDDVDNDQVRKMEKIDGTVEAGGWFGVEFIDKTNRRKRFLADVDFLADVANEYDGYTITGSVRGWYPLSRMFDIELGLGTVYASKNYMEKYFGVDSKDSESSGLPRFSASAGVKDFRVYPALVMHLNMHWHVAAGVQYRLLLDDADDSPVTMSSSQFIGGVGLAYSW